jgi:CubicO group peptidase (beta-lactamase class C family)
MHGALSSSAIEAYFDSVCPDQTPGLSWAVARSDGKTLRGWRGMAVTAPEPVPVAEDTLYDLASLTKPLATALLALRAFDAGKIDLFSPVEGIPGPSVTLLGLLRHEAGFPDWVPLYAYLMDRDHAASWLMTECPRGKSGKNVEYGCPGYILLGLILERALGDSLSDLFDEWIARPLGITKGAVCFRPAGLPARLIAATELDAAYETAMARRFGAEIPPFATGLAWGEVNDGNARFMGGASGNAGLFGTLGAVEILCKAYVPDEGFLSRKSLELAWDSPHPPGLGQRRTAGWKAVGSIGWWANGLLPQGSIGHEGFTGTGVWMEPGGKTTYILLTNRIHPRHPGTEFGPVRSGFIRAARGGL